MRLLLVGSWLYPWYQEACATALASLGAEVVPFSWRDDFYRPAATPGLFEPRSPWLAAQNRWLAGPRIAAVNARLVSMAQALTPDVIWFYNCTHIWPRTLRALQRLRVRPLLVQYANDSPFRQDGWLDYWRHLKRGLGLFDLQFAYRHSDIAAIRERTGRPAILLRSYFIPGRDFAPSSGAVACAGSSDAVFVGHFEPDGRLGALDALANADLRVSIFGNNWSPVVGQLPPDSRLRRSWPIRPAIGAEYRNAIWGSAIALNFLSKINADTYTRRNFEIPAMGGFMLSEYSDDLANLFREGVEAEFFRSTDELVDKARYYLGHDSARAAIAARGRERVWRDGHDVGSRMRLWLDAVNAAPRS